MRQNELVLWEKLEREGRRERREREGGREKMEREKEGKGREREGRVKGRGERGKGKRRKKIHVMYIMYMVASNNYGHMTLR